MNWTGGRLQRHSKDNEKSTDLARQKQHFAAVRQRLQNGETSQGTPFRPSFLVRDGLTLGNGVTPFAQGSQRHIGHSKAKQRSLEGYSSTAPVAKRLSSMQKRPATSRSHSARQQKLPSSDHRRSGETDLPQVKYKETSKDDSSPRNQRDAASTSSQHIADRKRGRSRLGEEDLLELSRKKLLLQNDWIGLAHSRPVQLSFTSRQDKERIGKRRRIDSGIEQRQRMFGKMKQANNDYGGAVTGQPPFMSGALGAVPGAAESISVRIGDHALSTQVSLAPHEPVRLREDVEQVRQSSESMLFDVEQRELFQPQEFRLTEERVEQEPRPRTGINHIQEQEASGFHALPVFISDDTNTDTSEDSALALDENTRELEPINKTAEVAIDEGLGVEQLLDQLNGQDNDDDQHDDDQAYSPILPVQDPQSAPAPFRLVFDTSSDHNDVLPSDSPLEPLPRDYGTFADRPDRNNLPSDADEADATMPNSVNVHTAQAGQAQVQGTGEVEPSEDNVQDIDAPWRKLFSISSSNSAFVIDEFGTEDVGSSHDSSHSINASLATTRDAGFKTLRPAQSLFEAESSVSIHNSPSASFRMITSLAAQPQRVSQADFLFMIFSYCEVTAASPIHWPSTES